MSPYLLKLLYCHLSLLGLTTHQPLLSFPQILENKQLFYDSKTILQEQVQKEGGGRLHYVLVEESGPEHDKQFHVEAMIDGKKIGEGIGRTKKHAEQQAAYQALLCGKKQDR